MEAKSPQYIYLTVIIEHVKRLYNAAKHRLNRWCKAHHITYGELANLLRKPFVYNNMVSLSNRFNRLWVKLTKLVKPPMVIKSPEASATSIFETKRHALEASPVYNKEEGNDNPSLAGVLDAVPCEYKRYVVKLENRVSELESLTDRLKSEKEEMIKVQANFDHETARDVLVLHSKIEELELLLQRYQFKTGIELDKQAKLVSSLKDLRGPIQVPRYTALNEHLNISVNARSARLPEIESLLIESADEILSNPRYDPDHYDPIVLPAEEYPLLPEVVVDILPYTSVTGDIRVSVGLLLPNYLEEAIQPSDLAQANDYHPPNRIIRRRGRRGRR